MKKLIRMFSLFSISFLTFSVFAAVCFADEQVTITTYYPAPYGIYREIRANQLAVGSLYRTSALADGNLLISGNAGIGTPTPSGKFDVSMGGSDHFYVNNDANVGLELRSGSSGGKPYIDFTNDNSVDYDTRLTLGQPYGVVGGIEVRGSDSSRNIAVTFMTAGGGPAVARTGEVWFCSAY